MSTESRVLTREELLLRYFGEAPPRPSFRGAKRLFLGGGGLLLLSLLFLLNADQAWIGSFIGVAALIASVVLASRGLFLLLHEKYLYEKAIGSIFPQPSDREVTQWFAEALERIRRHSLEVLDLTEEDCDQTGMPPIIGPVVSLREGVAPEHIVSKVGQDGLVRFGVNEISYLWLAPDHVGIFSCIYDLIRDVVLNEATQEFFYRDVVSVSTRERSSSISLPTGVSLTSVEEFRISVSNDQYFAVIVGAEQLKRVTGAERLPSNGCETAVRILRTKLREKKDGLLIGH